MVSSKAILVAFCVCLLAERCGSKRGGLGMGRVGGGSSRSGTNMGRLGGSRGSSSSRSSSMGAGMTHGGSGGGLFGGGTRIGSHGSQTGSRIGGGGWNSQTGGGWNKNRGNQGGGSWAHGSSRGHIPRTSTYSKSGVGSFLRSNKFKNAIVGAAAGYLTYQAGKALIRSAVAPMINQKTIVMELGRGGLRLH
ncbi:unnamed protein product [Toxocara canis]|uniref:Glycine-rich cell wall structural protein-like n=1 Tax=Toxocara canis TaxID=6265 RepID=A0A183UFQ0_TOXCA|nr:unnamed protein product [Toxocara canis]